VTDHLPMEVEVAWDEFHRTVNMTAQELSAWLTTDASGETASTADAGMDLATLGQQVVRILGKRKVDLTEEDGDIMGRVVDYVADSLGSPPPDGADDEKWRRSLMTVGHNPSKAV
jgi:hypothetical protein